MTELTEYEKMCRVAYEQGLVRTEPKVGDVVFIKYDPTFKSKKYFDVIQDKEGDYYCFYAYAERLKIYHKNLTFIKFSMEQLFEMVYKIFPIDDILEDLATDASNCLIENIKDIQVSLLKMYIKSEHSKRWNAEAERWE